MKMYFHTYSINNEYLSDEIMNEIKYSWNPKCINVHNTFKSDKTSLMHFYELSDIHQKELNIYQIRDI